MRKITKLIGTTIIASALLASSASAAIGDIKVKTGGVNVAPVMDGKISVEEYGNCTPLVLDGSGKNTEGTWAGTSWLTEKFTIYTAWDADNLYLGFTVEGDTTNNQVARGAGGFGKSDTIQIGFNPGAIVKGQHPLIYAVHMDDGDCYIDADAYQSEKDGEQSISDYKGFKAFCTKYSADGINYTFETAIPWDQLCVKGAGRSGEGAKVFDMTGELSKIGAGYELPFIFIYTDVDSNGKPVYIRTDATTGAQWVAEEMGSVVLQLQAAPKVSSAAQTADTSALILLASLASAGAALALKKRK